MADHGHWGAIVRWRRLILLHTVIIAVVAAIVSLLLPQWFRARTSLLPSEDEPIVPGMVRALQQLGGTEIGLPVSGTSPELYIEILNSHSIARRIVERFGLVDLYREKNEEMAARTLRDRTEIILTRNGVIEVYVEARDRELAAEMANAFPEELERFNTESRSWKAKRTREFVEERLAEAETEMRELTAEVRAFQEEHSTIELTEQVRASITVASEILTQIYTLEMEKSMLERFQRETHPEIATLNAQIEKLEERLAELDRGHGADPGDGGNAREEEGITGFLPPLSRIPEIAATYVRLLEEMEARKTILMLLRSRYEDSRIEEARDTPTLEVLDRAHPPTLRARPVRSVIVLVAAAAALLLGSLAAVFYESYRKRLASGGGGDLRYLIDEISSDAAALRERVKRLRGSGP